MQSPRMYTASVAHITDLTSSVRHFVLSTSESIVFLPGQYGTFIINPTTRRQYSFCSNPQDEHVIEIVVDTKPGGPGSNYFLEKRVGDAVEFLAPLGNFILRDSPNKKIFVATGTGIAPIRSMVQSERMHAPWVIYWGLRHEEDVYWQDFFEGLIKINNQNTFSLVLSQPSAHWKGLRGHVTDYVLREPGLSGGEWYLCGNAAMISEVTKVLGDQGVKTDLIHTDSFF